ncbi:MAG: VWA domain-containing protein [Saprospiraceae bacterium]|nr:VWA domain-containing protein [Saprospiraceae bacterium]
MFRFEHTDYFYLLLALPVVALVFLWALRWKRRAIARFGNPDLVGRLMPGLSQFRVFAKVGLLLFAVALLTIALANPQWGVKREKVKRRGIDIFLAIDLSRSMLAQDLQPSRLARAQLFAGELLERLQGEQVGVIAFACNAQLQVPLTTDYSFAQLFLNSASTDMVASQGTAIGEAIDLAQKAFPEDNERHKALVILSDGEDHVGAAGDLASLAKDDGIIIFTIGVGTSDGEFIPIQRVTGEDYLRDQTGNPVRSRLEPATLKEVAEKGGGAYFDLSAGTDAVMAALTERIDRIEKREYEARAFSEYESYFQYFVGLALLLLVAEFFTSYRKRSSTLNV